MLSSASWRSREFSVHILLCLVVQDDVSSVFILMHLLPRSSIIAAGGGLEWFGTSREINLVGVNVAELLIGSKGL